MAKKKPSIGEVLALYETFGPQAQQKQQVDQRSALIAQVLQSLGIVQGVQNLEAAPQERASRLAFEGANTEAVRGNTAINKALLPGQLTAQQGANTATDLANQNATVMNPIQQRTAQILQQGEQVKVDRMPKAYANEDAESTARIDSIKAQAEGLRATTAAQLLPGIQAILGQYADVSKNIPGGGVTPEMLSQVLAHVSGIPAVAEGFAKTAGAREVLQAQQAKMASQKDESWIDWLRSGLRGASGGPSGGIGSGGAFTR